MPWPRVSLVIVRNEIPILLWAPPTVVPIAQSVNCARSGTYHLRDKPASRLLE